MASVRLVIADFSPTSGVNLQALAEGVLGFRDRIGATWFAHDGQVVAAPTSAEPVRELLVAGWRVVEHETGTHRTRSLRWTDGAQHLEIRGRVSPLVRVATIGDGRALLLDPEHGRLELLTLHGPTLAIALPRISMPFDVEPLSRDRILTALGDGHVVIANARRAYWFSADELVAATTAGSIDWRYTWTFPRGDRTARATGIVRSSAWGRTNITVDDATLSFGETSLHAGDTVTLVDVLWDALGSKQFREVIRPDGSRERLPGAPELVETDTSLVEPIVVETLPVVIPELIAHAVAALREEGLLADADENVVCDLVDGAQEPDSVYDFLVAYYRDPRRATADRFIYFDYRYSLPDDDVIAYLAKLHGGPPPLRQLERSNGAIVVEGAHGRETIVREYTEGFDLATVIDTFDRALGMRDDPMRFYTLMSSSIDLGLYVLPVERAERLREAGVL